MMAKLNSDVFQLNWGFGSVYPATLMDVVPIKFSLRLWCTKLSTVEHWSIMTSSIPLVANIFPNLSMVTNEVDLFTVYTSSHLEYASTITWQLFPWKGPVKSTWALDNGHSGNSGGLAGAFDIPDTSLTLLSIHARPLSVASGKRSFWRIFMTMEWP